MEHTQVTAFGKLLGVMGRVFHVTLDEDMKAAYLLALDDLPFEAVQAAARQIFREETFMPVPAVVRSYAKDWVRSHPRGQPTRALYEPDLATAQVRALIASVWPEEHTYAPQQDDSAAVHPRGLPDLPPHPGAGYDQ